MDYEDDKVSSACARWRLGRTDGVPYDRRRVEQQGGKVDHTARRRQKPQWCQPQKHVLDTGVPARRCSRLRYGVAARRVMGHNRHEDPARAGQGLDEPADSVRSDYRTGERHAVSPVIVLRPRSAMQEQRNRQDVLRLRL